MDEVVDRDDALESGPTGLCAAGGIECPWAEDTKSGFADCRGPLCANISDTTTYAPVC